MWPSTSSCWANRPRLRPSGLCAAALQTLPEAGIFLAKPASGKKKTRLQQKSCLPRVRKNNGVVSAKHRCRNAKTTPLFPPACAVALFRLCQAAVRANTPERENSPAAGTSLTGSPPAPARRKEKPQGSFIKTLGAFCCGVTRNRTGDTRIFSPLLYQLSYDTIQVMLKTIPFGIAGAKVWSFFHPCNFFGRKIRKNKKKVRFILHLSQLFVILHPQKPLGK